MLIATAKKYIYLWKGCETKNGAQKLETTLGGFLDIIGCLETLMLKVWSKGSAGVRLKKTKSHTFSGQISTPIPSQFDQGGVIDEKPVKLTVDVKQRGQNIEENNNNSCTTKKNAFSRKNEGRCFQSFTNIGHSQKKHTRLPAGFLESFPEHFLSFCFIYFYLLLISVFFFLAWGGGH